MEGRSVATARLLLRPLTREEAEAVLSGEAVGRSWAPGYPAPGDREVARALLEHPPQTYLEAVLGIRQIVLRASREVIGGIGFFSGPEGPERVEVGYGVAAPFRGRGLATEALLAMLDLARGRPEVRLVTARVEPGNEASIRVLEKAGFRRVGADTRYVHFEVEVQVEG